MLWSEFIPYREAIRVPLQEAADRMAKLGGDQVSKPLHHVEQMLKDDWILVERLKRLRGGDFDIPAYLLINQYSAYDSVAAGWCKSVTKTLENARFVHQVSTMLSLVGETAETVSPETVSDLLSVTAYALCVYAALGDAPALNGPVMALGGALAADSIRKIIWIHDVRDKQRKQQLSDDGLRAVLKDIVPALRKVNAQLEMTAQSFDATYKFIVGQLADFCKNAENVLSLSATT